MTMPKPQHEATSAVELDGTRYTLIQNGRTGAKRLMIAGDIRGFWGEAQSEQNILLCPLTPENAAELRRRLTWLNPVPLGLRTSAGFGDRLGLATPGHIAAVRDTSIAPIFAQQSVRENARTGRTPQQVLDDAMWSVFECGWREAWGADADHLKNPEDIIAFTEAGYTFFTIDPGDHVDDSAEIDDQAVVQAKAERLDWTLLHTTLSESRSRYLKTFDLPDLTLTFDETTLLRAWAKYGAAIAHTVHMTQQIRKYGAGRPVEIEVSVDETGTTTSWHEHFLIASELLRLNVPFVSLAPRFVGRFEKGVDYIGNLSELEENIAGHAAIMRHFGSAYKLSLHTGSDKFGVYPIAMSHTGGLLHLKTAGTSYLEALRVMAVVEPARFREVLDFARERYENDRKTYHVSAVLARVPFGSTLSDTDLPALLDQFDARQVLHVTFGSVLDHFGRLLKALLNDHAAAYHEGIQRHFERHLHGLRLP